MADERKQIGAYEIIKRLDTAEGAQGRIYHVRKDGADFILKAPEHAPHREAEILAWKQATQRHHPNVLSLVETFTDTDGQVYLVSQFVDQGTLKDWLGKQTEKKAPTQVEALAIFRGIVAGLAHVHAADLTHRDLKPGNILLSHLHPLLMDFGLSRVTAKTVATMGVGGTLGYAPPEIAIELMKELMGARGESASLFKQATPISKRGDVWSAGVILYELLFGKRPFEDIDQLRDLSIPVPKLETLPAPLVQFLGKALAKDPRQRFANGQELATAFKEMEADLREWEIQQRIAAEQAKRKQAEDEAAKAKASAEAERKRREEAERAKERAEARIAPPTKSRRFIISAGLTGLVAVSLYAGVRLGGSGTMNLATPTPIPRSSTPIPKPTVTPRPTATPDPERQEKPDPEVNTARTQMPIRILYSPTTRPTPEGNLKSENGYFTPMEIPPPSGNSVGESSLNPGKDKIMPEIKDDIKPKTKNNVVLKRPSVVRKRPLESKPTPKPQSGLNSPSAEILNPNTKK